MIEPPGQRADAAGYRPVIMDFGLARESGEGKGLTEAGTLMGTPAYMPPEQARGESTLMDRRSDVYSLGATLYELLAGAPPFDAESLVDLLFKVISHPAPALRTVLPAAPEALETIVGKCLNKDPARRYPSARALAEDLDRFLRGEPILGKKLNLLHRLSWRARRNKLVTALLLTLLVVLGAIATLGLRARARTLAKEQKAQRQEALAQQLGQEVERREWQIRSAYSAPLHDTTAEKDEVRASLAALDQKLRGEEDIGAGLGHYVLGRGHLMLRSYDRAYDHLKRAEASGIQDPELDYALGRVLGERYNKAMEDAERSGGDKAFCEQRKRELDQEYLEPILDYLRKSRGRTKVSANYLQGLIDFYNRQYDAALLNAYFAQRQTPWLYEATQLEGDIYIARALDEMARGDNERAEQDFKKGIVCYQRAAESGRSDHYLYDAIARAWCSLMMLDLNRFLSPEPRLQEVLQASHQAIEASPKESFGYTYLSQAYYILAKYLQTTERQDRLGPIWESMIAGERGIQLHPEEPETYRWTADAYMQNAKYLARYKPDQIEHFETSLEKAQEYLAEASKLSPNDPRTLSTQGHLYEMQAALLLDLGKDPSALVERSLAAMRRAIAIDSGQADHYVQLSVAYWLLAQHRTEYGKSSAELIQAVAAAMPAAFSLGAHDHIDRAYIGLLYCSQAKHCLDAGCEVEPLIDQALGHFQQGLIRSERRSHRPYLNAEWAYDLKARSQLQRGRNPAEALRLGLDAAQACQNLAPAEAYCYIHEASLLLSDGEWRRIQGSSPLPSLERALLRARKGVELAGRSQAADAHLVLGRVYRQKVLHQLTRAPGARAEAGTLEMVAQGLLATADTLRIYPERPRALALQGSLFLLRARLTADAAERAHAIELAGQSLRRALALNPSLQRAFGSVLAETESLAAAAPGAPP